MYCYLCNSVWMYNSLIFLRMWVKTTHLVIDYLSLWSMKNYLLYFIFVIWAYFIQTVQLHNAHFYVFYMCNFEFYNNIFLLLEKYWMLHCYCRDSGPEIVFIHFFSSLKVNAGEPRFLKLIDSTVFTFSQHCIILSTIEF